MDFYYVSMIFAGILVFAALFIPIILILKRPSSVHKLKLTIYVFVLIWIARFAVGLADALINSSGLTPGEAFFDSMIHALQTFSMDEDYTDYTLTGKELLLNGGFPVWSAVYGIVISVLNVCAPILGGALLLEILTSVFPRIKIALMPFRHKFVFSELNAEGAALAEDLYKDDHYKYCFPENIKRSRRSHLRPVVIFTDAYEEEGSEVKSELFTRVKTLGAVCVKTDLKHMSFRRSKTVDYFLIDRDSRGNISSLSHLLRPDEKGRMLWPEPMKDRKKKETEKVPATRIFFFRQSDMDTPLVQNVREKEKAGADKVLIRMINDYQNTAINLVHKYPLFLPLLKQETKQAQEPETIQNKTAAECAKNAAACEKSRTLSVTILGSGEIAQEVFKAVYWCGQMLDTELSIRVLSKDAKAFECRLKEEYPQVLESCREDSPILQIYPSDNEEHSAEDRNPPYARAEFYTVKDALILSEYPEDILGHTDYYVIALGSDERNIAAADKIRFHHMRKLSDRGGSHLVIAPVVYDQNMAAAVRDLDPEPFAPYMLPFAALNERYSCKNVFMNDFTADALQTALNYSKKEQNNFFKDGYSYWANIGKTIHAPYKAFSIGRIRAVSLDADAAERYTVDRSLTDHTEPDPGEKAEGGRMLTPLERDRLGWLEHRRWNAFLRAQGFATPSKEQYETYYHTYGKHKCVPLKLHNCLVETESFSSGRQLPTEWEYLHGEYDPADYDWLDTVTFRAYDIENKAVSAEPGKDGLRGMDYKQYDFYEQDDAFKNLMGIKNPED